MHCIEESSRKPETAVIVKAWLQCWLLPGVWELVWYLVGFPLFPKWEARFIVPKLFIKQWGLCWTSVFLLGVWNSGTGQAESAHMTRPPERPWGLSFPHTLSVSSQFSSGGIKHILCDWGLLEACTWFSSHLCHVSFLFTDFALYPFTVLNLSLG